MVLCAYIYTCVIYLWIHKYIYICVCRHPSAGVCVCVDHARTAARKLPVDP